MSSPLPTLRDAGGLERHLHSGPRGLQDKPADELRNVLRFKYLGRVLSHDDNDVPAMWRNLKRAQATWGRVSKILTRQEVPAPVAGTFYQAVMAAVLLYGSESWVLPPSALKVLKGFHVEMAQ